MEEVEQAMSQLTDVFSRLDPNDQRKVRERLERLVNSLYCVQENQHPGEKERSEVDERLRGFDMEHCQAYRELEKRNLARRTHAALLSIAQVIAKCLNLNIDRESRRRKKLLIKWYDDNLDVVLPALDKLELVFESDEADEDQQDNNTETS